MYLLTSHCDKETKVVPIQYNLFTYEHLGGVDRYKFGWDHSHGYLSKTSPQFSGLLS